MQSKRSAGLLMFRSVNGSLEVLLAHPGGPFSRNKDEGAWTIPKGEIGTDEEPIARAKIEFEEELGVVPHGPWIDLGSVKQKGGKTVYAWAFEGNVTDQFEPVSNTFEMEWPPRSGRLERFPEVDRASFFPIAEAMRKINVAQAAFLERLRAVVNLPSQGRGDATAAVPED
jgi:predicted NUDIX family NTP pyrophosphohydrolase